jgi:hypothetical protein
MLDYSEKRDFPRMTMECPGLYRPEGAPQPAPTLVKNLSGGGVLLLTEQPVAADTQIALEILPGKNVTPPLSAYVKVIRCDATEEGNYALACALVRILPEEEVGPDFP